jgi:hypothetical protein
MLIINSLDLSNILLVHILNLFPSRFFPFPILLTPQPPSYDCNKLNIRGKEKKRLGIEKEDPGDLELI